MITSNFSDDSRPIVSTLWACVLINALLQNSNELFRPTVLFELLGGYMNGAPISEIFLFSFGLVLELQIAMVLLNRILSENNLSWADGIVASLSLALLVVQIKHGLVTPLYMALQFTFILAIVWYAIIRRKLDQIIAAITPPIA